MMFLLVWQPMALTFILMRKCRGNATLEAPKKNFVLMILGILELSALEPSFLERPWIHLPLLIVVTIMEVSRAIIIST